jgi:hypothetical protein
MKRLISPFLLIASLVSARPCFSQYGDSPSTLQKDTLPPAINWNSPPVKRVFPYKSFIVPAVFVAYGVFSIQNYDLRKVNEKLKEEVYTDRSSPQKLNIDNYLVFAPALRIRLECHGYQG